MGVQKYFRYYHIIGDGGKNLNLKKFSQEFLKYKRNNILYTVLNESMVSFYKNVPNEFSAFAPTSTPFQKYEEN